MTSREELQFWQNGVNAFDRGKLKESLNWFRQAGPYAKIHFNIGMLYIKAKDYRSAEMMFDQALELDNYFAIAHFQKGYSLFKQNEYELAVDCYKSTIELFKENDYIDYEQLGMQYKLYKCESYFNLAMCLYKLKYYDLYQQQIEKAVSTACTSEQRTFIDEWAQNEGEVVLYKISTNLFKLNEAKVKNLEKKKFLPEAKLVMNDIAAEQSAGFIGFSGAPSLGNSLDFSGSTLARKKPRDTVRNSSVRKGSLPIKMKPSVEITPEDDTANSTRNGIPTSSQSKTFFIGRKTKSPLAENDEFQFKSGRSYSEDSGFGESNESSIQIQVKCKNGVKNIKIQRNIQFEKFIGILNEKLKMDIKEYQLGYFEENDPDTFILVEDQDDLEIAFGSQKLLKLSIL